MNKFAALATVLLVSGCASGPSSTSYPVVSKVTAVEYSREAKQVVDQLVGSYRVTDSRLNNQKIDLIKLVLLENTLSAQFLNSGGTSLVEQVVFDACSGDVKNKNSDNIYLACSAGSSPKAYVMFSGINTNEVHKSGAIIPVYSAMEMKPGTFLIQRGDIDGRSIFKPFAAEKLK